MPDAPKVARKSSRPPKRSTSASRRRSTPAGEIGWSLLTVAQSMPTEEIAARAYRLYEEFRPAIPAGVTGWGAAGELDLDLIEGLSERR